MKMSDVFELPVIVNSEYDIEVGPGQFLIASTDASDQQSEFAAHAINNYDSLVDAITGLLETLDGNDIYFMEGYDATSVNKADDLLAELGETK